MVGYRIPGRPVMAEQLEISLGTVPRRPWTCVVATKPQRNTAVLLKCVRKLSGNWATTGNYPWVAYPSTSLIFVNKIFVQVVDLFSSVLIMLSSKLSQRQNRTRDSCCHWESRDQASLTLTSQEHREILCGGRGSACIQVFRCPEACSQFALCSAGFLELEVTRWMDAGSHIYWLPEMPMLAAAAKRFRLG